MLCGGGRRLLPRLSSSSNAAAFYSRRLVCCSNISTTAGGGGISAANTSTRSLTTISSSSSSSSSNHHGSFVEVLPSVEAALAKGRPVVALESTIIAHGMPYPENWQLCHRVSLILRKAGVEPATVAILNGACRIGLTFDELHDLAQTGATMAQKCTTRDVSLLLARQQLYAKNNSNDESVYPPPPRWGATTVASTMALAHQASNGRIATFVTGGIGGVHRHGQDSMDVSADLLELARIPMVVVSAGIKSILDIPRTLQVLETQGVATVAYQADEMPAFFSPNSGVAAPARVESAEEVAAAYWAARDLGLQHGMLVAVPNTDPAGQHVEQAIQAALLEAQERGIDGPVVTPFVLKRVSETTGGDSLRSNMALVERNAEVGAEIAVAIANQQQRRKQQGDGVVLASTSSGSIQNTTMTASTTTKVPSSRVVVLGGIVLDVVAKPSNCDVPLLLGTSNPATCTESNGGVARNIAEVLGRLGDRPLLYSAVGKDARGAAIVTNLQEQCGVLLQANETVQVVDGANTATFVAVLNEKGDLHAACADMDVLSKIQPPPVNIIKQAEILVLDANPPVHVLRQAAACATEWGVKVYWDPTSVPKAALVAKDNVFMSHLTCAFPNRDELQAMAAAATCSNKGSAEGVNKEAKATRAEGMLENVEEQACLVLATMNPHAAQLVVTLGEKGVLFASRCGDTDSVSFQHFPIPTATLEMKNSTGAGDSLCGAYIHAILNGKEPHEAVRIGMNAAMLSLSSERTISDQLGRTTLTNS